MLELQRNKFTIQQKEGPSNWNSGKGLHTQTEANILYEEKIRLDFNADSYDI